MHDSARQHQSVAEQEEAQLGHLLVDPDQFNETLDENDKFGSELVELPESWRYLSESGICSSGLLRRAAS